LPATTSVARRIALSEPLRRMLINHRLPTFPPKAR